MIHSRDTVAVTIAQHGAPSRAVLVSNDFETLIYEWWDSTSGEPSSKPMTISLSEISEVSVD